MGTDTQFVETDPAAIPILKTVCDAFLPLLWEKAEELFAGEQEWSGRKGFYFCCTEGEAGAPLCILLVGAVPKEKVHKYVTLSQEKARRLSENSSHLSSFESRDPALDRYGGAVRFCEEFIFSASGLPELGDEALMLALAACMIPSEATSDEKTELWAVLDGIAQTSSNPYWKKLKSLIPDIVAEIEAEFAE